MKVLKKSKGFTLVELIVVIAIIGILAAVLIPSLTGYITKARESNATQEAKSVYDIYVAYLTEVESDQEAKGQKFTAYYEQITKIDVPEGTTVWEAWTNGTSGTKLMEVNGGYENEEGSTTPDYFVYTYKYSGSKTIDVKITPNGTTEIIPND